MFHKLKHQLTFLPYYQKTNVHYLFDKKHQEREDANRWPNMYKAILDTYPMLKLYLEEKGTWGVLEDFEVEVVVEYINLVERVNKIDRLLSK